MTTELAISESGRAVAIRRIEGELTRGFTAPLARLQEEQGAIEARLADLGERCPQWVTSHSTPEGQLKIFLWDPSLPRGGGLRAYATRPSNDAAQGQHDFDAAVYVQKDQVILFKPQGLLYLQTCMVIWDECNNIAVMRLPEGTRNYKQSETGCLPVMECVTEILAKGGAPRAGRAGDAAVLCVRAHPLSQRHICVLWSDNALVIYKLDPQPGEEAAEQFVDVPPQSTSFSFAEGSGWGALAVYVLTKDSSVYSVCPVLPYEVALPLSLVRTLEGSLKTLEEAEGFQAHQAAVDWLTSVRLYPPEERDAFCDQRQEMVFLRSHSSFPPALPRQLQVNEATQEITNHLKANGRAGEICVLRPPKTSVVALLCAVPDLRTSRGGESVAACTVLLSHDCVLPAWRHRSWQQDAESHSGNSLQQCQVMQVVELAKSQGPRSKVRLVPDPYAAERVLISTSDQVFSLALPSLSRLQLASWLPAALHTVVGGEAQQGIKVAGAVATFVMGVGDMLLCTMECKKELQWKVVPLPLAPSRATLEAVSGLEDGALDGQFQLSPECTQSEQLIEQVEEVTRLLASQPKELQDIKVQAQQVSLPSQPLKDDKAVHTACEDILRVSQEAAAQAGYMQENANMLLGIQKQVEELKASLAQRVKGLQGSDTAYDKQMEDLESHRDSLQNRLTTLRNQQGQLRSAGERRLRRAADDLTSEVSVAEREITKLNDKKTEDGKGAKAAKLRGIRERAAIEEGLYGETLEWAIQQLRENKASTEEVGQQTKALGALTDQLGEGLIREP